MSPDVSPKLGALKVLTKWPSNHSGDMTVNGLGDDEEERYQRAIYTLDMSNNGDLNWTA